MSAVDPRDPHAVGDPALGRALERPTSPVLLLNVAAVAAGGRLERAALTVAGWLLARVEPSLG